MSVHADPGAATPAAGPVPTPPFAFDPHRPSRRRPARPAAAWERLVRCYGPRLTTVARRAFHAAGTRELCSEAEDLVQEVWCRLFEYCDAQGWRACLPAGAEARIYGYLVRTTRNLAVDRARAHRALKRGGSPLRPRHGCRPGTRTAARRPVTRGCSLRHRARHRDAVRELVSPDPSPEERAMRRQGRALFLRRCRPYTSRGRRRRDLAILELALVDGWSSRQIADTVDGVTPSAVDTLVHRVRRGLAAEGLEVPSRR